MAEETKHLYEFGPFRLDATERSLSRDGQPLALTPKALDTLLVLVQKRGRVLDKDELLQKIWPDSFVEEATLAQNIFKLRKILGEDESGHPYIETIPKRGYRFIAQVRETQVSGDGRTGIGGQVSGVGKMGVEEDQAGVADQVSGIGDWRSVGSTGFPTSDTRYPTPDIRQPITDTPHPIADTRHPTPDIRFPGTRHPTRSARHPTFLIVFLLLIGLATGLVYFWNSRASRRPDPGTTTRTIAVLPFKLVVGTGGDEYLGLGMADALISRLGNIKTIIVRPTSAVRRYADAGQDPLAAGRALGVDSVLDGSIQRLGDRIRVTVQLLSVRDGTQLWAEKFHDKFTDIFAMQDSISDQVSRALMLKLTEEERSRLTKRYTENTEAYQAYLKGRYFWNKRTEEGYKKAIEYFSEAIKTDPNYAQAYAGLADTYVLLGSLANTLLHRSEAMLKAREAALKALAIDETLAEAHTSLAFVKMQYDWDWPAAEREFKRAIELNPRYATAHHWYAYYLVSLGRLDESMSEIERAQEADPLSLIINTDVGEILYYARRYDQAIEQCRKVLDMDSNFALAHRVIGWAYEQKGMHAQAIAELNKAINLSRGQSGSIAFLGHAYALSGNRSDALEILKQLQASSKQGSAPVFDLALVYTGLNEKDQAFAWLEKSYQQRVGSLILLKVWPVFDPLRSDPRFTDLVRRVGLTP